jgi:RNA polymerase primary sigma factor
MARLPFESYLVEIDRTPLLSLDSEKDLARQIAAGDRGARDQMVRANLRLVVGIARQYSHRGLGLEDLISEGNVGLMRAVEGFDQKMGNRFSTYASYWIKQSIRGALNKSAHAVRLPQYMSCLLIKWRQTEAECRDVLGREASREEVAARLGLTPRQFRAVTKGQKAIASGKTGRADDEECDVVPDDRSLPPDEYVDAADEARVAIARLDGLGTRAAKILRLRYGLGGEEPATLREIGKRLGLHKERIRQIERDSLAVLRNQLVG